MRKQAEWIEYTGSDEQIAELNAAIRNNNNGILVSLKDNTTRIVYDNLYGYDFDKYLICNPHPYADMARQQLLTGQPVWVRYEWRDSTGPNVETYATDTPDWNIPGAEYSLSEFKGEV